jgi:hypothetical protein
VDEMPLSGEPINIVDFLPLADLPWPAENGPAGFLRTGSHFKADPA